jgi:MFS transporter, OPA family, glycerol-3-phosphate transporter
VKPAPLKHWQCRIFANAWFTYFAYYLCRLNMPMAKTRLCETFSWDAAGIGFVFSAMTLMYAVGQFVNGQLADRFGARAIASLGALGSVFANLAVFAVVMLAPRHSNPTVLLVIITILWGGNGFFQAMGWPPMVRLLAYWFPSANRGTVMGLLGTCYQLGGAVAWFLAFFLTGYCATQLGLDWRTVFAVPAALLAAAGLAFFVFVRNHPEDVGVTGPDGHETQAQASDAKREQNIATNVMTTLRNPYLWIVAATFFTLDVNRYGFVNWLPAYLDEQGGASSATLWGSLGEVMKRCIHPLAGSAGAIMAGWATDRYFGGRRAPVIAILLALLGGFSLLFPFIAPTQRWLLMAVVGLIGFCTYGPHILMVGHAAQDFGRKHGAAGAAGFIDALGYIGASLAGWGAGVLIHSRGYKLTFLVFGSAALVGSVLITFIWKAGPGCPVPGADSEAAN